MPWVNITPLTGIEALRQPAVSHRAHRGGSESPSSKRYPISTPVNLEPGVFTPPFTTLRCGGPPAILLLSQWNCVKLPFGNQMDDKREKKDVLQGTLALMVLKTLDVLGPMHGYSIARRIEQISGDLLTLNQGTLYPVLLKLEQEGSIASEWGASDNNRKARFYRLTRAGRQQLRAETQSWEQTAAIIGRFFAVRGEDLK